MILISACLLGIRCRYDGTCRTVEPLLDSPDRKEFVPICPEQLGGLTTPREPSTMMRGDGEAVLDGKAKVITTSGRDVTGNFLAGAEAALQIVSIVGIEKAVLKENSPSCGLNRTYIDGTQQPGKGVLAAALVRTGIPLFTEKDFHT